jgi:hydrogenase nickel incorporation protein HypA/HybF
MHERSLIAGLVRRIDEICRVEHAERATRVTVRLGALSHISAEHFREHFEREAAGCAAGAVLEVLVDADPSGPHAQEVVLESVEVEIS